MALRPHLQNQVQLSNVRKKNIVKRANRGKIQAKWLHPKPMEKEYEKDLRRIVFEWRQLYLQIIDPMLEPLAVQAYINRPDVELDALSADDWSSDLQEMLNRYKFALDESVEDVPFLAQNIGQKTSDWNDRQWRKVMISAIGVDLSQAEPWLPGMLNNFVQENVALIDKLKEDTYSEISRVIRQGYQAGKRPETIRKEILSLVADQPGVFRKASNRAALIARDQVSKLNGQLTKTRHDSIGISTYIWSTSGDERVRANHRVMDGKYCRWDDATVYKNSREDTRWLSRSSIGGVQLHPGQDYQCRCVGNPDFSSIFTAEELQQIGE